MCVHEVMIEQHVQEAPAAAAAVGESSNADQKRGTSVFCPVTPSKKSSGAAFCPVVVGEEGVESVVATVDKATAARAPQVQEETSA